MNAVIVISLFLFAPNIYCMYMEDEDSGHALSQCITSTIITLEYAQRDYERAYHSGIPGDMSKAKDQLGPRVDATQETLCSFLAQAKSESLPGLLDRICESKTLLPQTKQSIVFGIQETQAPTFEALIADDAQDRKLRRTLLHYLWLPEYEFENVYAQGYHPIYLGYAAKYWMDE